MNDLAELRQVQANLHEGYMPAGIKRTYELPPRLVVAVRMYQRKHGLKSEVSAVRALLAIALRFDGAA